jgi:hypothetical protein
MRPMTGRITAAERTIRRNSNPAMKVDVVQWLSRLPLAEEQAGDGIVLDGWLGRGEHGRADIFTGGLRISVRSQEILEVGSAETDRIPAPFSLKPVRIVVRRGAALLDIRPHELCEQLPPKRKPFALAVRPSHQPLGPADRFRELEREFLRKHGLTDA